MKLAYAILADAAEIGPNGKVSMLGGEFETIFAAEIPTVHTRLSLVVKLLVEAAEWGIERTFRVALTDPEGAPHGPELETQFVPKRPVDQLDRGGKFLIVVTFPPILFLVEGEYVLHLFVDDTELGTVALTVSPMSPTSRGNGNSSADKASLD